MNTHEWLNLYIVNGESTDGTMMFSYVSAVVVAAESEEAARKIADHADLHGNLAKYKVQKIGITTEEEIEFSGQLKNLRGGCIDKFLTQDY